MREAALGAGKRMRPLLMMLLARDLGCPPAGMLDAACAVELVHAASLILDDMPCMDNAMLRRGRPTIHVRFGEDVAILAAISLLSRAFGLVASAPGIPADARTRMSSTLANAIGTKGLAMGQYQDLRSGRGKRSCDDIAVTNELKTGMLFDVAVNMATVIAEAGDSVVLPLKRFAKAAGQGFQIRDDLLDCLDSAVTGKDTGNDAGKATIVLTMGVEEAQRQLAHLVRIGTWSARWASRPGPGCLFVRCLLTRRRLSQCRAFQSQCAGRRSLPANAHSAWVPAFAGMTVLGPTVSRPSSRRTPGPILSWMKLQTMNQERFGASHLSTSSFDSPRRLTMSSTWSLPIFPTTKYFDCGCAM